MLAKYGALYGAMARTFGITADDVRKLYPRDCAEMLGIDEDDDAPVATGAPVGTRAETGPRGEEEHRRAMEFVMNLALEQNVGGD